MSQLFDDNDKLQSDNLLLMDKIKNITGKPAAILEEWSIAEFWGVRVLFGLCTKHEGRPDLVGKRIHTSALMNIATHKQKGDGYAETKNTVYWLGTPSEERPYNGRPDSA